MCDTNITATRKTAYDVVEIKHAKADHIVVTKRCTAPEKGTGIKL